MFSRKKPEPAKNRKHDLSQFGLMEIPDDFDPSVGYGADDGGDSDLEAELAAISSGGNKPRPKAKPKTLMPSSDLDRMIADSLKDISDGDDDDLETDTDLLGELENITGVDVNVDMEANIVPTTTTPEEPPSLLLPTTADDTVSILKHRIEIYKQAETDAKAAGESAKARRFGRGLKTLADLLKQANAGKTIDSNDIPPEIKVKTKETPNASNESENTTPTSPLVDDRPKVPSRVAPAPPVSTVVSESPVSNTTEINDAVNGENPLLEQMRVRQQEYKSAALKAKRNNDKTTALQFLSVVKQFDIVIKMCLDGKEVDLSDMPPPPDQFMEFLAKMQNSSANEDTSEPTTASVGAEPVSPVETEVANSAVTMLEALQQRLDKYKAVEESAKTEGNASKSRRFGRIVKQYEDAIKQYKSGRVVAFDELPIPPGFGPLPTENGAPSATVLPPPSKPTTPSPSSSSIHTTPTTSPSTAPKRPSPQKQELTTRTSGNQQKNNLAEQQMKTLLERQNEFKVAAIEAKKAGELEQAKEYLKIFKGFEKLLNAASSGLPVDLNTLPLPPSQRENLEASFAIVTTDECDPDEDISDIGMRIEEQLVKQLMMCKNTRDHHKAMGDVAGMNRFENLAVTVQKDLDLVRYSKRKNFPLPKFHYEKRSFNIVHCNTDLTDCELEIVIVRGMNYNVTNPKDVDTYVKIEFPLLNDEMFKTKTTLIKDTDSPDYDQRFKVDIQRNNRQFQRIFKRHGVKFEVYSRGGFLRSDILIGTVNVKLQPLETKCDIHDTFDLMEGRKTVGGKLEIKLRVRNPILTKQIEHINEKWLMLDA
ncbi:coiled-coil and C2 domain-containing protein 1-like isoform X2 [Teleopsis dalmanni]|uniref:coiled-coil and C2 domain-containing protein 1-like isoform X2 n=1 Tax=Teleopsis dalmanni TaxID=139649 RepID=UPI0018CCF243|nr:coiled-coil and C2 domain-containing protein 1-like isoform X2 [Teleopsis dalmanni]